MTTKRFGTLLQREWMQHQRGWWILMGLPLVVMLLVGIFGTVDVQLDADDDTSVVRTPPALMLALGSVGGMAAVTFALAWASSLFQAPGLARRDQQDRSLEFWLSLPAGHAQSLGATLLTHLLLVPWIALAFGAAGGLLVSLILVTKAWGIGEWLTLPWGAILVAVAAMLVRLSVGLVLATLWLSPLILVTMAASAWLKRWGLPLVAGVLALAWVGLDKIWGWTFVGDIFKVLTRSAGRALIGSPPSQMSVPAGSEGIEFVRALPVWAMQDLGGALQALFSPGLALALAIAAAGFTLLVLRRSRGA